jgi:hypothetical protein
VTDDQTSTVRGDAELIARAGHLFDAVHDEFACAARDLATWSAPEARSAVARRVLAASTDSFTVRKLFSPLALADEAQRAHLRRLDAGAQVRISSAPLPHETIILDRRVAILAGQPSPLGREYTVTTSPPWSAGSTRCSPPPGRRPPTSAPTCAARSPTSLPRPGRSCGRSARASPTRRLPGGWAPRCAPTGGGSPS